MKKLLYLAIVVVACCVMLWLRHGFVSGAQSVHYILANAPQLAGKEVDVSGIAGHSIAVWGMGGFEITGEDGSTLTVISSQGVPRAGTKVTVHGVLRQAYASGTEQELILLEAPQAPNEGRKSP